MKSLAMLLLVVFNAAAVQAAQQCIGCPVLVNNDKATINNLVHQNVLALKIPAPLWNQQKIVPPIINVLDEDQKALLCLFERPFELLSVPRGRAGEQIIFHIEGEEIEDMIGTRWENSRVVNIPADVLVPNIMDLLPNCNRLQRGKTFTRFNPLHRAAGKELTRLFMNPEITTMKLLWNVAASIKDRVNEELFIYALSYAIIRNPAFDSRLVPAIYEVFPNKFITQDTRHQCMQEVRSSQYKNPLSLIGNIVVPQMVPNTGTDLNHENRLAYWREDYGINSYHWHWHLVFPLGDQVRRDRKGELFFYMHNQMVARYDWERLSNRLNRVVKLNNWREPIPEGYFSKLTTTNSRFNFGTRPDNMIPQDTARRDNIFDMDISFDISDLERWTDRLFDAIHNNYMIKENGDRCHLNDSMALCDEKRGIDILGDAFEADEDLSVNFAYYGSLHNTGHEMIASIHDPRGFHNEELGVMGDSATALRDPIFYRWHRFVDDLFQEYKMQQVPYEDEELCFDSVIVESVSVHSEGLFKNNLETSWAIRSIEASRGLDFLSLDQPIMVDIQHLTHKDFTYNIEVKNTNDVPVGVTVRLYMAPKYNEAGDEMTFNDQRLLWAEMDRYSTTLTPGSNFLKRHSTNSSITIPDDMTFRDITQTPPIMGSPSANRGCGWPQHLLLPMGKPEGMDFQIFVLISDGELDKVVDGWSFCGILDNRNYPDARPMGYPFDRTPNLRVNNIEIMNAYNFSNALPNAFMADIKIFFRDSFQPCLNLGK